MNLRRYYNTLVITTSVKKIKRNTFLFYLLLSLRLVVVCVGVPVCVRDFRKKVLECRLSSLDHRQRLLFPRRRRRRDRNGIGARHPILYLAATRHEIPRGKRTTDISNLRLTRIMSYHSVNS